MKYIIADVSLSVTNMDILFYIFIVFYTKILNIKVNFNIHFSSWARHRIQWLKVITL